VHLLTRLGVFLLKHFPLKGISDVIGVKPAVDDEYIENVRKWREAWHGEMPHNIGDADNPAIPSLQIAKRACALVANNVAVGLESEAQGNESFNKDYQKAVNEVRDDVEATCAVSQIIWRPNVDIENKKVVTVTSEAGSYLPLRYNRLGEMVSVAFIEQQKQKDQHYTLVTKCDFSNGIYSIENKAYKGDATSVSNEVDLTTVESWKDLLPYEEHKASRPWFVELTAPSCESIFDRAMDLIKEADKQDFRLTWENEGGEMAVFASADMFKDVGTKNALNPKASEFKPEIPKGKERLYNVGNYSPTDSKIHIHNPDLRNEGLTFRKNDIKREIEDILGFPRGSLSEAEFAMKTATEVIDGKSNFAVVVQTLRDRLSVALENLAIVMYEVGTAAKLYKKGKFEIVTQFEDFLLTPEQRMTKFKEEWAVYQGAVAMGAMKIEVALAWFMENSPTYYKISEDAINKAKEQLPERLETEY